MSKAFTKESDLPEAPLRPRPAVLLPPGAKNYLTAGGAHQLQRELDHLLSTERPRLAAVSEDEEAKPRLQAIDQRIQHLQQTLHTAVVVAPSTSADGTVRFGATVTVREPSGVFSTYRIVGIDETDLDRNWVSWLSPIAKALLNARVGDRVRFKFPSGEEELEIVSVAYE
ncbi:MAG TPA: GreA/GreB family elongation factor [Methylomirabilota bacterium]|nr:GreA/GreB family elongation factor [Methylomirabilota bacterium]